MQFSILVFVYYYQYKCITFLNIFQQHAKNKSIIYLSHQQHQKVHHSAITDKQIYINITKLKRKIINIKKT